MSFAYESRYPYSESARSYHPHPEQPIPYFPPGYPAISMVPVLPHVSRAPRPALSSYSALSGALGPHHPSTPPIVPSQHPAHTYSQHHTSTGQPSNPYPYFPSIPCPEHSRSRSRSIHEDQGGVGPTRRRHSKSCTCTNYTPKPQKAPPGPCGPTNHEVVPQRKYTENVKKPRNYLDPVFRFPPIQFQLKDFPEPGIRIMKILARDMPPIQGGKDQVLAVRDREIKIKILWPGYNSEPFEKRMKTHDGTVPRETLLMVLANTVLDFIAHIQKSKVAVEPGFEEWAVGPQPDGSRGIIGPELFITALVHRAGSYWQPEIWAPKKQNRALATAGW